MMYNFPASESLDILSRECSLVMRSRADWKVAMASWYFSGLGRCTVLEELVSLIFELCKVLHGLSCYVFIYYIYIIFRDDKQDEHRWKCTINMTISTIVTKKYYFINRNAIIVRIGV